MKEISYIVGRNPIETRNLISKSCTPRHAVADPLLIAGNEDDTDRLSSWSVLMHRTTLYVPSICDVQRRQSCVHFNGARTTGVHTRLD